MSLNAKLNSHSKHEVDMLEELFRVYDSWTGQYSFSCRQGCSACCTQSVTITSVEGEKILAYAREQGLIDSLANRLKKCQPGIRPTQTTNEFARSCLMHEERETSKDESWDFTPCIFLQNDLCTIYPVRPFGCRSFSSMLSCIENGCAEVPPILITVNTVVMQIVEHVNSHGGMWGNMTDILKNLLFDAEIEVKWNLLPAQPNPGFLIPPEEMQEVASFFARINGSSIKGETLVELFQNSLKHDV